MSETSLPAIKPYHPITFLERGVAVPFTTPLLAGTRARPVDRLGVELIVPNPSGGRGVYIMGWNGIAALCSPTLHDRMLTERIERLTTVTPSGMRRIARQIAAEGLAGEEASRAARTSEEHDKADRLVSNYLLLMALVDQVESAIPGARRAKASAADIRDRARHAVHEIAPRLGRTTEWVASALEAISDALANIGVSPDGETSRIGRLVAMLTRCKEEIMDWQRIRRRDDESAYAEMICGVADATLALAEEMMAQARRPTGDVVGLLRLWTTDADEITRLAARPEWLLDGWEPICLLWELALDDADRRAALVEMAGQVPVIPREAWEWTEKFTERDISMRLRRLIPLNEDWRTGAAVFEQIARNEHLRALAC